MLALIMPLLPHASPARADVLWGAAAGLSGGIGVALLYHALATGTMAVVAPTTAVCAVAIPVVVSVLLGERPMPLAVAGIARSEEHTSELQSRLHLVCRLLLEKKKILGAGHKASS